MLIERLIQLGEATLAEQLEKSLQSQLYMVSDCDRSREQCLFLALFALEHLDKLNKEETTKLITTVEILVGNCACKTPKPTITDLVERIGLILNTKFIILNRTKIIVNHG